MCTLILIDRVVPGCPVLVAANRDEFYARPSAPPSRFEARNPDGPWVVAPQDLEAGGTWMGLNAAGLFVGLTNRSSEQLATGRRSRGLLVSDALQKRSAAEVAGDARVLERDAYNPFHLVYADGREAYLTVQGDAGVTTTPLEPGVHVVCNRDPEDGTSGKVAALRRALERVPLRAPFGQIFDALKAVLRSHAHATNPHENACVHTEDYGTRSSAIIATGPETQGYWYAAGPPCETKFRNVSRLLRGAGDGS